MTVACTQCGQPGAGATARFCAICGAPLHTTPSTPTVAVYPIGLINSCRVLAAASMFSGLLAIMNFDTGSTPGRILIVASVIVSLFGQLFAMQASKDTPPPWIGLLLPCFWIGLAALPILWIALWGQR
jgi:hypothetical protein